MTSLNTYKLILSLISMAFNLETTYAFEDYVLVKEDACFDSLRYTVGYSFYPPLNGQIIGIKLVYKSGSVTCNTVDHPTADATNWGCTDCGADLFVEMVEESKSSMYPTATTQGITSFTPLTCDVASVCAVWFAQISGYDSCSDYLEFKDYSNPNDVNIYQEFSLQYGEGCCNVTAWDNQGVTCADVYFIYSAYYTDSPTVHPTKVPSSAPTEIPSSAPTEIPSSHPNVSPTGIPTVSPTLYPSNSLTYHSTHEEEMKVEQDTTDAPKRHSEDESQVTGSNNLTMIIVVGSICVVICVCVAIMYVHKKKKERLQAAFDAMFGLEGDAVSLETHANSHNIQTNKKDTCNTNAVIEHKRTDDDAAGVHQTADQMKDNVNNGMSANASKYEFALHKQCNDCEKEDFGKIYDGDGLFYCNECWQSYQ